MFEIFFDRNPTSPLFQPSNYFDEHYPFSFLSFLLLEKRERAEFATLIKTNPSPIGPKKSTDLKFVEKKVFVGCKENLHQTALILIQYNKCSLNTIFHSYVFFFLSLTCIAWSRVMCSKLTPFTFWMRCPGAKPFSFASEPSSTWLMKTPIPCSDPPRISNPNEPPSSGLSETLIDRGRLPPSGWFEPRLPATGWTLWLGLVGDAARLCGREAMGGQRR